MMSYSYPKNQSITQQVHPSVQQKPWRATASLEDHDITPESTHFSAAATKTEKLQLSWQIATSLWQVHSSVQQSNSMLCPYITLPDHWLNIHAYQQPMVITKRSTTSIYSVVQEVGVGAVPRWLPIISELLWSQW